LAIPQEENREKIDSEIWKNLAIPLEGNEKWKFWNEKNWKI
jgi:hypothetical protein